MKTDWTECAIIAMSRNGTMIGKQTPNGQEQSKEKRTGNSEKVKDSTDENKANLKNQEKNQFK